MDSRGVGFLLKRDAVADVVRNAGLARSVAHLKPMGLIKG